MKTQYRVIILDPDPEPAELELQAWANRGFKVVAVYCEDRVILEKAVK